MDVCTIENKYGSLIIDSGQKPRLGLQAFAEYFRLFSECVFMPNEKLFYIYNRKSQYNRKYSYEKNFFHGYTPFRDNIRQNLSESCPILAFVTKL